MLIQALQIAGQGFLLCAISRSRREQGLSGAGNPNAWAALVAAVGAVLVLPVTEISAVHATFGDYVVFRMGSVDTSNDGNGYDPTNHSDRRDMTWNPYILQVEPGSPSRATATATERSR